MEIGVVVVTYNRKKDLEKALKVYENQTFLPSYVLVVDNKSTDGTHDMLNEWKNKKCDFKKYVITLPQNIGGSGGFYTGLEKGLELNADWIWVSDDDAYPEKDALEKIYNYITKTDKAIIDNISAVCGQIVNHGKTDITHRKRIKTTLLNIKQTPVPVSEYKSESFELNLFSYVGTVINKKYLKKVGLPEKQYFIYYDDTEHSYRLNRLGKIVCLPNVKIIHDVDLRTSADIDWKGYYAIRNRMLFFKKHFNKRYYTYNYGKFMVKITMKNILGIKGVGNTQLRVALEDSKHDIKGMHDVYKPGWKRN